MDLPQRRRQIADHSALPLPGTRTRHHQRLRPRTVLVHEQDRCQRRPKALRQHRALLLMHRQLDSLRQFAGTRSVPQKQFFVINRRLQLASRIRARLRLLRRNHAQLRQVQIELHVARIAECLIPLLRHHHERHAAEYSGQQSQHRVRRQIRPRRSARRPACAARLRCRDLRVRPRARGFARAGRSSDRRWRGLRPLMA